MVAEAVRVLGQRAPRLSGIVANAGIMGLPRFETIFGHEKQYMVNHVAHALLIKGLLERLSEVGRIVIVSSGAHRAAPSSGIDFHTLTTGEGYRPWQAYGRSKLANLLFARALSKRLPAGQTVNALHPGVIKTDLGRHLGPLGRLAWTAGAPLFFKSIEQGAATQCYLAAHPGVASISGRYFANCRERRSTRKGADLHLAERLFEHTMTLLGEFEGKTSLAL
jgi:WW domain-containing oxidoreductase